MSYMGRRLIGPTIVCLTAMAVGIPSLNRVNSQVQLKTNQSNIEHLVDHETPIKIEEKPISEIKVALKLEQKKIDYKTSDFSSDSDEILLARMLFGESRDCTYKEKLAIGYTVINRANDGKKYNGENVREVILKDKNYSCFNNNNPNRVILMDPEMYEPKSWRECLQSSRDILSNKSIESNKGQTNYHTRRSHPYWSSSDILRINFKDKKFKHIFYKEK